MTFQLPLLSFILLLPLVAFFIILALPERSEGAIKSVASVSGLLTLILSIFVWIKFDPTHSGFQFVEKIDWISDLGISYHLGVDGVGVLMTVLNALVFFTGSLSMWTLKLRVKAYFAFMLMLVIGVFGVFLSLDLFFFFFFYEVAVLPMYPLILVWGSTKKEYAAMKLTLFLMAGSALLFPSLIALYQEAGLNSWSLTTLSSFAYNMDFQITIYPLLYIGFGILAGMFPFHGWSPTGHVAAPTAVSMLHAGVLMKLGAFGILRIAMTLLPLGAAYWSPSFAVLATANIVYGALVALRQNDFKYVIGFSSVSHMGIVLLGLNVLTLDAINGAVFQMFAHGVMTALFFSAVGFIYDQAHTRDIHQFGGLAKHIPVASAFFIIAGLCGMGVPGFASFWAELLVFIAAIKRFPILGALAVFALLISAMFMLRVYRSAFFGPANPRWQSLKEVTAWPAIPRIILIATLLLFGFFPKPILSLISPTVLNLLRPY